MKKIISILLIVASLPKTISFAQVDLNHLDISVTAGSTGIGFDIAMPVNDLIQVRAGASFMPHFQKTMEYGIEVGDLDPNLSTAENAALSTSRFNDLAKLLEDVTGDKINQNINMIGEPTFNNFKLLVDFFPFKENKHWHFTMGFYWGSSEVAKAFNTTSGMTSLMGMAMYNNMYKNANSEQPLIEYNGQSIYLPSGFTEKITEYGEMGVVIGEYSHDIYAQENVYWDYTAYDAITGETSHEKGDLRYAKGDKMHNAGDEYRLTPDENNMIKANVKTNSFRPYLGFGYGAAITKDNRTNISFDAGMMFWGGTPTITMHDGTNVINDLQNIRGKFNDYADFVSGLKVYPVINLRLTRRLF